MSTPTPDLLAPGFLTQLAARATNDALVARQRLLANLQIGFRNSETGRTGWLHVTASQIEAGDAMDEQHAPPFTFVGDTDAMQALAQGFPFNRLVRQHRLVVVGDLRHCVQNWLLIYAILRLANTPEHL